MYNLYIILYKIMYNLYIIMYKSAFCSKQGCQNTSWAAKVLAGSEILLLAAL